MEETEKKEKLKFKTGPKNAVLLGLLTQLMEKKEVSRPQLAKRTGQAYQSVVSRFKRELSFNDFVEYLEVLGYDYELLIIDKETKKITAATSDAGSELIDTCFPSETINIMDVNPKQVKIDTYETIIEYLNQKVEELKK